MLNELKGNLGVFEKGFELLLTDLLILEILLGVRSEWTVSVLCDLN